MKHWAWLSLSCGFAGACASPDVVARLHDDVVAVTVRDRPFAAVHIGAGPRPYVWPLFGPSGVPMTRDHPMGERIGEQQDHPHHQSMWVAHGDVDGFDFWHGRGHRERLELVSGRVGQSGEAASVDAEYRWCVDDGVVLLRERRHYEFSVGADDEVRFVDLRIELEAVDGPRRLGDTKEGTVAVRVHPELRAEGPVATATLTNSEGDQGRAVWGTRARWIDNSGKVGGREVGIAMFDHPDNVRHPTWWHARTYGLLAANPFGVHDFDKEPAGTGDLMLQPGEPLVQRYRFVLHGAGWTAARIERAFQQWVAE